MSGENQNRPESLGGYFLGGAGALVLLVVVGANIKQNSTHSQPEQRVSIGSTEADTISAEQAAAAGAEAAAEAAAAAGEAALAVEIDGNNAAAELDERYTEFEKRREIFAAQSEARIRKSEALQSMVNSRREEDEQRRQDQQLESINCNLVQTREAIEDHIEEKENRSHTFKPRFAPRVRTGC